MTEKPPSVLSCCGVECIRDYSRQRVQITPVFDPYYDPSIGRIISSKGQIEEICKRDGKIYGNDSDIDSETDKNSKNNNDEYQKRSDERFSKKFLEALDVPAHSSANFREALSKEPIVYDLD